MSWGSEVRVGMRRVSIYQGHFQKQAGFGLVESFISIVLLAGFLLSACHLFLNLFSSKLLDQTASRFIDSFQKARQVAIETNTSIKVKAIGESWGDGWQVIPMNSETSVPEFSQALHVQNQLEEPVTFIGHQELSIIFKPNGMTSNLNPLGDRGIIFCNANGKGRQLTMLASGQVQVTDIKQGCGVS